MAAKDRFETIRQILINDKKVMVADLSEVFQVTEETIRRDLEKMEDEGFLTRTYGGAILNEVSNTENIHFYKRSQKNLKEKQIIANKALPIIKETSTMSVDSASTSIELVKLLKDRKDLTILTNSIAVLQELELSDVRVVSIGGEFNKNSLSLQGQLAKDNIKKYHVDIIVMSCKGLDMEAGVLDSNESEAEIKKAMISQASEVALLVDSSKFDQKAFVKLVEFKYVDYVITDKKPDTKWIELFEKNNIKIIY
ncbi:MAG: DeoR/GlpR family DNA-binding transcription regulator [Vallitaleaceae bacterium]|nr:DeoR/GlpR family DNA-binding transcription regulator [Vallitaleaceae bacterium]